MVQSFISKDDEIAQIRERLAALEDDKARLQARLHEHCTADSKHDVAPHPVAKG
jgi:ubiquinone biosynthesis protein UbiJ